MTDEGRTPELPSIVDAMGATSLQPKPVPRHRVIAWALWDWATQPFNSVIITFVFTALYLTQDGFLDPEVRALGEDSQAYSDGLAVLARDLATGGIVAGVLVALLAPVLGQRADARGRRKWWLAVTSGLLVLSMFGLFFVQESPSYFWWGVALISFGQIVSEIAGVNYNAMLTDVSTPSTVGRVSGLGWGMGYVGGIVALLIVVVADGAGWWGLDTSNGMAYRLIAVGAAVWALVFGWAVFVFVPEAPHGRNVPTVGFFEGYKVLWNDLVGLWRNAPATLWFLISSAVYRDGLVGIFTFGAIIAAQAFDFSDSGVIMFGVAANLVAGATTMLAGLFDDRLGPRKVIVAALSLISVSGVAIVALADLGQITFWIFGLLLSACVGPAQAASRSLLSRVTPAGHEAQIFGLYATTGRAASFLSPLGWWLAIAIAGATIWGTLGVIAVVVIGLALLVWVRVDNRSADAPVGA